MPETTRHLSFVKKRILTNQPSDVLRLLGGVYEKLREAGVEEKDLLKPDLKKTDEAVLWCQDLEHVLNRIGVLKDDDQLQTTVRLLQEYFKSYFGTTLAIRTHADPLSEAQAWIQTLEALERKFELQTQKKVKLHFTSMYLGILLEALLEKGQTDFSKLVELLDKKAEQLDMAHLGILLKLAVRTEADSVNFENLLELIDRKAAQLNAPHLGELLKLAVREKAETVNFGSLLDLMRGDKVEQLDAHHLGILLKLAMRAKAEEVNLGNLLDLVQGEKIEQLNERHLGELIAVAKHQYKAQRLTPVYRKQLEDIVLKKGPKLDYRHRKSLKGLGIEIDA